MDHDPPSLKKQLITTLIIALAVLAIGVIFTVFQIIRHLDLKEFDSDLEKQLDTIATMTTVGQLDPVEIQMELHEFDPPEFQPSATAKYYQMWDSSNETFLKSRSLTNANLPNFATGLGELVVKDIDLPDGRAGRLASRTIMVEPRGKFDPRPEEAALLQKYQPGPQYQMALSLAVSREELDHILGIELAFSVLTALILIGGAVGIVHFVINQTFRKFEHLAKEMESIDYGTLSARLPEQGLPRELLPFSTQFNSLLVRLQGGVERERRFATNISHELRTPISELRLLTEVGKRECDRGEMQDPATYFNDATELTIKMDRLVETVSSFNKLTSGREKPVIESFHLAPVVTKACDAHAREASEREIVIEQSVPQDAVVQSDRSLLSAVLCNLIGNATSHSPIGSTIKLSTCRDGSLYRVEIENPNTELEPDDLGKLGEPFWQKDSARSGDEHFGMGIALVESYCSLVGIDCLFSLPQPDVFRASLAIPSPGERSAAETTAA